jgi:hypothetical protein
MVLNNLKGPSNWIPSALSGPMDNAAFRTSVMVGLIAIGLVAVYQVAKWKSYKAGLWTAFLLWLAGNFVRMQEVRLLEARMASGTLGLTGSLGLLMMGVLYVRRSWKQKQSSNATAPESDAG